MLFVGGVQRQRREENLPRDVGTHRLPKIDHEKANNTEAIHATPDVQANNTEAIHATPDVVEALVQTIIGEADNPGLDAAPNDRDVYAQAILGEADNSAPDAAPDHSSADRAADRALHTNMCSCRCGELH